MRVSSCCETTGAVIHRAEREVLARLVRLASPSDSHQVRIRLRILVIALVLFTCLSRFSLGGFVPESAYFVRRSDPLHGG